MVTENQIENKSKQSYTTPELVSYGNVRTLTQAGQSGMAEENSNSINKKASDRSTKQNIVRVGTHALGMGLYLFDYKPEFRDAWGHGRQFGVMADEVEVVMPEAVSVHPNGYKMVDYAMLGISRNLH